MYGNSYYSQSKTNKMAIMAMIFGIISIASCYVFYVSIPLGAMAAIFASLSRNQSYNYSKKARTGMILGLVGIVASAIITGILITILLREFGSFEGILREYCRIMELDFETIYGPLFQ